MPSGEYLYVNIVTIFLKYVPGISIFLLNHTLFVKMLVYILDAYTRIVLYNRNIIMQHNMYSELSEFANYYAYMLISKYLICRRTETCAPERSENAEIVIEFREKFTLKKHFL
jgi:hypothetical protein